MAYKAASIGEANNLETSNLEELIGSLRTFEMELREDKKQKKRTMAFQVEPQQVEEKEGDDLTESMALLIKNFNQVAINMNKRLKGTYQTQNTNFASNPSTTPFKVNRFSGVNIEPTNKSKGIQCRECEGYGHIHAECANTRKKNKSYTMTWINEESEEREEPSSEVMVFVSLPTTKDPLASAASHAASFLMADVESSDDEEIEMKRWSTPIGS